MIEYKIKYKDTQRASGDENNQIRGISIIDGHRETLSITGNIVIIGPGAMSVAPPNIGSSPLATRLALWQTYADFFYIGMTVRVTGTAADGDYVISGITEHPPTSGGLPDDPGSLAINTSSGPGGLDSGVNDVLFEDVTTPEIIELQGSGSPDILQTIDNNEDKFTTIRAKQLTIQFIATQTVDINTFAKGEDNKFYVESWINDRDNIEFKGYLITDDLQQPFLPIEGNIIVQLLATDRLGTLKDVALSDDDKLTPQGKWKISQYLSWILKKTGLNLDIYVVNNIRHGTGSFSALSTYQNSSGWIALSDAYVKRFYPGQKITISGTASNNGVKTVINAAVVNILGFDFAIVSVEETLTDETDVTATFTDATSATHLYDTVYVDAKTFEGTEPGTCENSYSALDKIMRDQCFIEQSKGSWWIHRIAEMEGSSVAVAHFDPDGVYVDTQTKTYSKSIGRNETIKFANANALLRLRRAYSYIKETYRYDYPIETVCNFDFTRGDFTADAADETVNDQVYNVKKYGIECWMNTHSPFTPGQTSPSPSFDAYIKRLFQNGYEKQRYVVLPTTPSGTDFLESQPIEITAKDKFSVSIDFAWNADAGSGSVNLASILYVTLKGNDGTNWFLDVDGKWNSAGSGGTWSPLNGIGMSWDAGDVDEREFRTIGASANPAPVSGKLRFAVISIGSVSGGLDDKDMYYNNFNFTYIPFINGSYQKYTGQTHTVSQDGEYKAKRENQVFISDSPRNIFKGAMFWFNGTEYILTGPFYDSFAHPTPAVADIKPFGEIQAQDVWTQFNREMRIFSGSIKGLDSDVQDSDDLPDGPDLIHQYLLTDSNQSTDNKVFLMLSYEQDRKSQLSQSTLIEVFDSVEGKTPGEHSFKYLSE